MVVRCHIRADVHRSEGLICPGATCTCGSPNLGCPASVSRIDSLLLAGNDNAHLLLTPRYDQEASRTRMAVRAQREEKSNFVVKLEEVLPEIQERFGVTKIGIFGSTARGDGRPESDVDVLVELSPDHLTFRNFTALADFLEELYGRKVDLLTVGGIDPLIRQDVESEVVWCEA